MRKLFCVLVAAIFIFSCKKSEAPADTCRISATTIVGTYKITAMKYKASSSATEQDWFSFLADCDKDNSFELKTDNSVVVGDGANVCPGPPPPGTVTAWSLSADTKVFTLDAVYDVISFDCITLIVTEKDRLVAGDTRTVTYVKQ